MRKLFYLFILFLSTFAKAQDRIVSFGYAFNIINSDSSNYAIQVDLNRIRGLSEAAGSYFLVNTPLPGNKFPLRFYLKPTADVNIGSGTSLLPNNISVGLPFGFAHKFKNTSNGTFFLAAELSPEFVGDKTLSQYLYYVSPGLVLNYGIVPDKKATNIDLSIGIYRAFGRRMHDVKTKVKNDYGKISVPVALSISLFKNNKDDFHYVKLTGVYKHNYIMEDNFTINPNKTNNFMNFKLDFFPIKKLGLNFSYSSGRDEPLFKQVKSFIAGFTFAR